MRVVIVAMLALAGCSESVVTWNDVVYSDGPPEPAESVRAVTVPVFAGCEVSLRVASNGESSFAAWWSARRDSSVMLVTSRSLREGPWSLPVVADSTDRGVRGCGRPAPAIAADPASGYVHLAYFLEPAGGGGVFFAHSMDSGATFHSAVPIVFGRNPVRTSVASHGNRVAVAYEDPNSKSALIGVALSKTMGHIFEKHTLASTVNGNARQPVVQLTADSIRLWWSEYSDNPSISATRPRYRAGRWK